MKVLKLIFFFFSGSRILGVTVTKEQMYPMKLKGISICFSMLKAALCGSYVNFGVFRLYGDDALDNALNSFVKLLLSIPQSDLLVGFRWGKQTNKQNSLRFLYFFPCCHQNFFFLTIILKLIFFRIIPNCLRPTTCFWNVWLKTTWAFLPQWNPKFSCTFCHQSRKG